MTILSFLRTNLRKMGICDGGEQNFMLSRAINAIVITVLVISTVTSFITSVISYPNLDVVFGSFYTTLTGLLNLITYPWIVCNRHKVLQLIENIDKTIQKRK